MRDATRFQKTYPPKQKPRFVPTNNFYSGEEDPPSSLGSSGDFYLKLSPPENNSVLLYGAKTGLEWGTPVELVGSVGAKGDQGETGLQGETGEPGPVGPSYDGKTGNTIWVTKQTDGAYESLQAAIDQSVSGDTILVGVGNWGDITLKAGVNIMGLQPPLGDKVVVSKITFVTDFYTSAATNTIFVSNLRVSNAANISIVDVRSGFGVPGGGGGGLGGDGDVDPIYGGPYRVSFSGCRFYRNNGAATQPLIKFSSPASDTESSVYLDGCIISPEGGQYSANLIQTAVRYLDLNNCKLWEGAKALRVVSGAVSVSNCRFETNYAGPSISLEVANTRLTLGESLIRNLGGNLAKGIQLVAASICAVSNTVFDISSGSETACIDGPALSLCYYGNITAVTPQPNPITGMLSETRSTNISGALTKMPFTQVS
jgi:hypothetical protein